MTDTRVTELVAEAAAAKEAANEAKEYFEKVQAEAIAALTEAGLPGLEIGETRYMIASRNTVKWDEEGLRKSLPTHELFDEVCKRTVVTSKVEKAVAEGKIPLAVAAAHSTVTPSKPWLSVGKVEAE